MELVRSAHSPRSPTDPDAWSLFMATTAIAHPPTTSIFRLWAMELISFRLLKGKMKKVVGVSPAHSIYDLTQMLRVVRHI